MALSDTSKLGVQGYNDPTMRSTSTPLCSSFNDSGYHSHQSSYTPFISLNRRSASLTPAESPLPPSSFSQVDLSDSVVQVLFEDDEDLRNSDLCLDIFQSISVDASTQCTTLNSTTDTSCVRTTDCLTKPVIHVPKDQLPHKRKQYWAQWSPGQEIGEKHVDFFRELGHYRNCADILSHVCGYLSPKDLLNVGQVSHTWRKLIESIPEVVKRRTHYIENRRFYGAGFGKENHQVSGKPRPRGPRTFGMPLTGLANQVQCPLPLSPVQKESPVTTSRLPQFQEQAKKLLPCEHLQPCPRCQFPSRVTPREKRAHCTSTRCSFDYCTQCKDNFHAPKPCKKTLLAGTLCRSPNKRDLIGHKGARRNLKRL